MTEAVYRGTLAWPGYGVQQLGAHLGLDEDTVRWALAVLSEMALVRFSGEDRDGVRAVDPRLGMEVLLARQQEQLSAQQQRIDATRAAAVKIIAAYAEEAPPAATAGMTYLHGLEAIRDQLQLLHHEVAEEFLTFATGGPQTPENMAASRPLNQNLLERGVRMRTVYLDAIRRDMPTLEHAKWLQSMGAQVRTVPTLPNRVIVIDRRAALIAADTDDTGAGAVLVTSPGMIALLCALFEQVWRSAEPIVQGAGPREKSLLSRQQQAVLELMAEGKTDESIANGLGVSTRTVRRIVTGLLTELGARSRFQAAIRAVQLGHLPGVPE
ncbi:LuxR C-terminal-related transcriptional regulator [Streptomyces sp. NPDC048436]|uniref:LuxR C-terminal-related transcriptional regulator n=1 Tax=Streptomyces sp. NPDC048436 TaxID=3365550 RepID=UPI00371F78BE